MRYPTSKKPIVEPEQEVKPVVEKHQDKPESHVGAGEGSSSPTSLSLTKLKLARNRNRESLASFYKNRENLGEALASSPITIVRDLGAGRKRKRILTKIVRKPYNPDTTTTAATQKVVSFTVWECKVFITTVFRLEIVFQYFIFLSERWRCSHCRQNCES